MFTDPSGNFIFSALIPGVGFLLDAACWGAVLGGAGYMASVGFSNGGFNNFNPKQFWKSVALGAISGVVTAGIGSALGPVGSGGFMGEFTRTFLHGFNGGCMSHLSGGDFFTGFASGGLGSLGGTAFSTYGGDIARTIGGQVGFSALSGGIGAELTGGDFWRGAATGATVGLLNHCSQQIKTNITKSLGGWVKSRQEGVQFIYENSSLENCELGLIEMTMKNGKTLYRIANWDLNDRNTCRWIAERIESYSDAESRIIYHTHLGENGPSYEDFQNNTSYNSGGKNSYARSFVINKSSVYEVNRWQGHAAPRGVAYGRYCSPVGNWLNGNFLGF
jgi:hypothetical protein